MLGMTVVRFSPLVILPLEKGSRKALLFVATVSLIEFKLDSATPPSPTEGSCL